MSNIEFSMSNVKVKRKKVDSPARVLLRKATQNIKRLRDLRFATRGRKTV